MGFNRDQFKPTSMTAIKTQEAEADAKRPKAGNLFGKIEPGRNILRIYPVHPNGGGINPWEQHCVSWLPVTAPARDENKRVIEGQTEVRRKSVFNSKVHGNTPKDLVEEYLRLVNDVLFKQYLTDKAEQATIWGWLTSFESKDAIAPQDSWALYASKKNGEVWGPVEQFDVKPTVKTGLNTIAAELSNDDPTSPDPFTDVNDGIPVVITKGKDPKNPNRTVYSVSFARVGTGRQSVYMEAPLSDEQLERFLTMEPLYKIYVNSYKRRDLELQLEGLKNIDDQLRTRRFKTKAGVEFVAGVSVFAIEEFQQLIDQMLELYPEEATTEGEDEDGGGSAEAPAIVAEGEEVLEGPTDDLPWDVEQPAASEPVAVSSPRQAAPPPVRKQQQPVVPTRPQQPVKLPAAKSPASRPQQPALKSQHEVAEPVAKSVTRGNGNGKVATPESAEKVAERLQQANAQSAAWDKKIQDIRAGIKKNPVKA